MSTTEGYRDDRAWRGGYAAGRDVGYDEGVRDGIRSERASAAGERERGWLVLLVGIAVGAVGASVGLLGVWALWV